MDKRKCEAARTILVPLDEETVPIAIAVPKHLHPHTHPPPPATKVPTDVKLLYERAIRAYGISVATVNKVEQASSTIEIMGAAPGLVHPSLLNVSTKQTIISGLKRREPGGEKSGCEGRQRPIMPTARSTKRHTSAIEQAKQVASRNKKIKDLKAELALLMAEAKTSSSGVVLFLVSVPAITYSLSLVGASKKEKITAEEMELDGTTPLEVPVELDVQPDALEQQKDLDASEASQSESGNLDVDGEVMSMGDSDIVVPLVVSVPTPTPSPIPPPPSRRSSRKREASNTHEDAPAPKSKKTEAAVAPEPSVSERKRPKREPKTWSVRHTDDQIYTSFEFAQFPEEYRALYGDTEPM
ncbi:hypothetical protein DFH09DRAFT_1315699 [Mycena vulgaris]|nr:hypothetical protein DFH09DRAFT_1315699 [Mycena vulgaris]